MSRDPATDPRPDGRHWEDRPRAGTLLPLDYWRDPRWQGLGSVGRDSFTLFLNHSADNLTDGEIPGPALRMLASLTDDPMGGIERLVASGLLVVRDDGSAAIPIEVVVEFNLTAAEVARRQAVSSEAGKKRAEGARRDPVTKRFLPTQPADEPAAAGSNAGSGAGSESQRTSQRTSQRRASPTTGHRPPTTDDRTPGGPSRTRSRKAKPGAVDKPTIVEGVCLDCSRPPSAHAPGCPVLRNPALLQVVE